MFIESSAALKDKLNAIKTSVLDAAGPVHTTIKLAIGAFTPTKDSVPGDFTEAGFDGYASKTITSWSAAYLVNGNQAEIAPGVALTWIPTGTVTPQTVVGYWLEAGDGTYLGGEIFANAVPMASPSNSLNVVPIYQQPVGNWSAVVVP
jgi:hypothetical protein